jgi:hypothetical protein
MVLEEKSLAALLNKIYYFLQLFCKRVSLKLWQPSKHKSNNASNASVLTQTQANLN